MVTRSVKQLEHEVLDCLRPGRGHGRDRGRHRTARTTSKPARPIPLRLHTDMAHALVRIDTRRAAERLRMTAGAGWYVCLVVAAGATLPSNVAWTLKILAQYDLTRRRRQR
jgi:hypothetical protein